MSKPVISRKPSIQNVDEIMHQFKSLRNGEQENRINVLVLYQKDENSPVKPHHRMIKFVQLMRSDVKLHILLEPDSTSVVLDDGIKLYSDEALEVFDITGYAMTIEELVRLNKASAKTVIFHRP